MDWSQISGGAIVLALGGIVVWRIVVFRYRRGKKGFSSMDHKAESKK